MKDEVTQGRAIFLLSDSIASVDDVVTMTQAEDDDGADSMFVIGGGNGA